MLAASILVLAIPGVFVCPALAADRPEPTIAEEELEGASSPRSGAPVLYRADLEKPDTLGVGRIARNVAHHLPALEAMTGWFGNRLARFGYERVRPVIARNNVEMVDFVERGIVDVLCEPPLSAIHLVKEAGATIVLRERRHGSAAYRSVVFVRSDSAIQTITDLRGHRIAFEDAGSTAFLLPLAEIKRAGLAATEVSRSADAHAAHAVEYSVQLTEAAILTAVERHAADAGALSDEDWEDFRRREPDAAANLRVIYRSDPVPRAFVLLGPTVSERQRDGIVEALLAMQTDTSGRAALHKYNEVDGFDEIDSALAHEIARLEGTYQIVREEIR
jgi:phosphonate transport system substrate-binding protein